jgi:S1-C subfamily serine protease
VLTNNHVVEGATSINVTDLGDGHTYKGTVVGYDQSADVAVVQLQGASGLQTAPLGSSSNVTVGQQVVGLGNAGGKGGTPSVAPGNVTALGQSITASDESSSSSEQLTGLIETNAPIQAGDSGGPLVSSTGQVIGMDTAASSGFQFQSSGQNQQTQSFAIPVNTAVSVANQIEAGTASSTVHIGTTGFLGVELQNSSSAGGNGFPGGSNGLPGGSGTANGAAVAGVVPGGPAAQLGLNAGDTITSLGGQTVNSPSDIQRVLNQYHPGDKVSVAWTDQFGQSQSGTLTLANGPVG